MAKKTERRPTGISERRRFRRVPVTLPVRFRLCDQEQQSGYQGGWSQNLCSGGVLLRSDAPVELIGSETKLRVQLRLGNDCLLNAMGKVVWMEESPSDNSHVLGICFTDLDPDAKEALHRFMEPLHSK